MIATLAAITAVGLLLMCDRAIWWAANRDQAKPSRHRRR